MHSSDCSLERQQRARTMEEQGVILWPGPHHRLLLRVTHREPLAHGALGQGIVLQGASCAGVDAL